MKEVPSLPSISKSNRHNGAEWIEEQELDLFVSVSLLKDEDEIRDFLLDIFSKKEIKSAAKRWCATRQLLDGIQQADIQSKCKMHRNTVGWAKKLILESGTGMSKIVHIRLKEAKTKQF